MDEGPRLRQHTPLDGSLIARFNAVRPPSATHRLCLAPFTNLYFGARGDVFASAAGRCFPLGHYPDDTIHDIWFGRKAAMLRDHVAREDLRLACFACLLCFRSSCFTSAPSLAYDSLRENPSGYPSELEFEISTHCNLECIMCSGHLSSAIRKNRHGLPPFESPYDEAFVDQLSEFIPHLQAVRFGGGEPFLAEKYFRIVDLIHTGNPEVAMTFTTNGTILNERIKRMIGKARATVILSLDAATRDTFESIRVNAHFDDVMRHFEFFREEARRGRIRLCTVMTVIRQNWHEIPELTRMCNELGVDVHFFAAWQPNHCTLWNLSSGKLREIRDYLSGFDFPENTHAQAETKRRYEHLVRQVSWLHLKALERERDEQEIAKIPRDSVDYLRAKAELVLKRNTEMSGGEIEEDLKPFTAALLGILGRLPDTYPRSMAYKRMDDVINMVNLEYVLLLIRLGNEEKLLEYLLSPFGIPTLVNC